MASIQKRPNGRWRARYRDPSGREHARHFQRKSDAQRWLDTVTTDLLTGRYVDPRAGKVKFGTFAEQWLAAQTFGPVTRANTTSRLNVHLLPHFGDLELARIRPSTVQTWLRGRMDVAAESSVQTMLVTLSSILRAAVADGLIAANPCESPAVRGPKVTRRKVVPWTVGQVQAIAAAHPDQYRAVPVVAAGLGLRQGEVFGLAVEDVDFLRRKVLVRQQVKLLSGRPVFAPPKGEREREVPLPDVVAVALAEHLRSYPSLEVAHPWGNLTGEERTSSLVFTTGRGRVVNRNSYNEGTWKPALIEASIAPTREHGMHACRHHYASVLLDGGVSIRALADYLGHADPGFTLRVYSHLMPDTEDRARAAIDDAHATSRDRLHAERR